jgi:hypothetical protein
MRIEYLKNTRTIEVLRGTFGIGRIKVAAFHVSLVGQPLFPASKIKSFQQIIRLRPCYVKLDPRGSS